MKIEIFNWAGERKITELIKEFGYEHREIIVGDVLAVANRFLEAGANVMILQGHNDVTYVLAIDTRSFGQR